MNGKRPVLLVEDDAGVRSQMRWALSDFDVEVAGDRAEAMAVARRIEPKVVVLDLGLPPDTNGATEGLATLSEILSFRPGTKVIVASGNEERANAIRAIELGAYDFYPKPVDVDVLKLIIERALHLHALEDEMRRLAAAQAPSPLTGIIANSPEMLKVCRAVERVASSDVTVLITGESGTGKEVIARALHQLSSRADKPFIAINCAAIPENLLESELFGHEKGAFTGAVRTTIGRTEQAHGGTLFLDEIGDMPMALQAKMLRFLQERVIERIGGRKAISVDVRIVSATNVNLAEMMKVGRFREDLFYRLNEVSIPLPSLRDRQGDAVLLANYFQAKFAQALDRPSRRFSPEALAAVARYQWPGNIRELENRVKRAVVMAEDKVLTVEDLDLPMEGVEASFPTLREVRAQAERQAIGRALDVAGGNVSQAAKLLGISRPTFYDLMESYGLKTE